MRTSSPRPICAMAMVITAAWSLPALLTAQSIRLDGHQHPALALEILKPNFDDAFFLSNTTFPTSVMFLSLRYPLSARAAVVTELPFAHGGVEFSTGSDGGENVSGSALGNPYLGLEIGGENSLFFAEIGARAPMTRINNLGTSIAVLAEFAERLEAFVPDYLPLIALANFQYRHHNGLSLRLRCGPSFWINTERQENDDATEWFLLYSAQAGYETETVSVQGGANGRWFLSVGEGSFGERTVHELGLAASLGLGRAWPGVQFRLPLDADLKEILDFSFGFHIGIRLR